MVAMTLRITMVMSPQKSQSDRKYAALAGARATCSLPEDPRVIEAAHRNLDFLLSSVYDASDLAAEHLADLCASGLTEGTIRIHRFRTALIRESDLITFVLSTS